MIVSPQIPAHFEGFRHPEGGAAGSVGGRNVVLDDRADDEGMVLEVAIGDVIHVNGLDCLKRDEFGESTVVWQHSAEFGLKMGVSLE